MRHKQRDTSLVVNNLHATIKKLFALDGDIKAFREEHRNVAFQPDRSPKLFAWHYLLSQAGSKYMDGSISASERYRTAIAGFIEAEENCRKSNERLWDVFSKPIDGKFHAQLHRARSLIAGVLGSKPNLDVLIRFCGFSSGASSEAGRSRSAIQIKWDEATHVTREALPYATAFLRWCDQTLIRRLVVTAGNKVFTVPKNYEKDRTCAAEPPWNMFFQKGVGSYIRQRLRWYVGLLHPDAQQTHARLAKQASIDGLLATEDLRAASDSISLSLVSLLFPEPWAQVLFDLRSKAGDVDGTPIVYEKLSSMGNGYTFEVETLIFWALVTAVCGRDDERISVYGDDIICPAAKIHEVRRLLRFCGFESNPDKSFAAGSFRESCGGHYYQGLDVKPFYVHRLPTTISEYVQLHNDIVAWIGRTGVRAQVLIDIARLCRRLVPRKYWGPLNYDGCLWSEWDEATPYFHSRGSRTKPDRRKPSFQHWRVLTRRKSTAKQRHDYLYGGLLQALWEQSPVGLRVMREVMYSYINFPCDKETDGWVEVPVRQQWPALPVYLA